jgi:STE24 endopeptidase
VATETSGQVLEAPGKAPEEAKRYVQSKLRIEILKLGLLLAFLLVFLLSGASEQLLGVFRSVSSNYYLQLSGYLLAFMAIYFCVFLGIDFYGDVVLERRFGLSNQTVAGWFVRTAKQWLLSVLLIEFGFNLLYRVIRASPDRWWLVASIGWFALLVVIGKITPAILVPLFYKLRPPTDRDLTERLHALAGRCGVPIRQVLEIRLSKETKKANAAVVGLGRDRRIMIGDTLLDLCSHDEIEAVFAHELGHVALHHSWKLLGTAAAGSVIGFYLLYLVLGPSAVALGFAGAGDIAALPLLLLWITGFGLAVRPLQAAYSRHFEKQADLFILGRVKDPRSLVSALLKLAGRNLADPQPSRLVELLFHDHPPIARRVAYLQAAAQQLNADSPEARQARDAAR